MSTVSHLTDDPGSQRRIITAAGKKPAGAASSSGPDASGDHAVPAADRPGPPGHIGPDRSVTEPGSRTTVRSWPLLVLAAPAAVAVWSGWVGIGQMTGFGEIRPLPGIWDSLHIDTAVTLPVGVEAYAAFALRAWLTRSPGIGDRTRRFARWSAIAALVLGMAGQVAYHLLRQAGMTRAPWEVTTLVSCLPVLVLGLGSALAHLLRADVAADGLSDDPAAGPASASRSGGYRAHASHHPSTGAACRAILGRHPVAAACGPVRSWRTGGGRTGTVGAQGGPPRRDWRGRPPARMRIAEARAAAAKVTASGRRVSRRSLRSAGLRGSNADLGMLARLVDAEPPGDETPAACRDLP